VKSCRVKNNCYKKHLKKEERRSTKTFRRKKKEDLQKLYKQKEQWKENGESQSTV